MVLKKFMTNIIYYLHIHNKYAIIIIKEVKLWN